MCHHVTELEPERIRDRVPTHDEKEPDEDESEVEPEPGVPTPSD